MGNFVRRKASRRKIILPDGVTRYRLSIADPIIYRCKECKEEAIPSTCIGDRRKWYPHKPTCSYYKPPTAKDIRVYDEYIDKRKAKAA